MFSYFPVVKKQRTFQTYLSGVSIFFIDNIILLNRDYFMHNDMKEPKETTSVMIF